jgi:hypothetical protein
VAIVTTFNTSTTINTHITFAIKENQKHVKVKLFYHQMEQLSNKVITAANFQTLATHQKTKIIQLQPSSESREKSQK